MPKSDFVYPENSQELIVKKEEINKIYNEI